LENAELTKMHDQNINNLEIQLKKANEKYAEYKATSIRLKRKNEKLVKTEATHEAEKTKLIEEHQKFIHKLNSSINVENEYQSQDNTGISHKRELSAIATACHRLTEVKNIPLRFSRNYP
jgi:hypothetical protein